MKRDKYYGYPYFMRTETSKNKVIIYNASHFKISEVVLQIVNRSLLQRHSPIYRLIAISSSISLNHLCHNTYQDHSLTLDATLVQMEMFYTCDVSENYKKKKSSYD